MRDFTTYLSTAPVAAILSLTVVAGVLIEINRFFPDALIFAFQLKLKRYMGITKILLFPCTIFKKSFNFFEYKNKFKFS